MRKKPLAASRLARWLSPRLAPFTLLCLLATGPPAAWAQWIKVPLRGQVTPVRFPATNPTARPQALGLPFFDDFADNALRPPALASLPDPARWASVGGVAVNNTVARNQPSLYVATFDGLRANGTPYDTLSPLAQGPTDTLLSLPIDLSGRQVSDSLYLSFFWEARGLGEQPDLNDSLTVQFKDNAGNWTTVWRQAGQFINPQGRVANVSNELFVPALVPLTAPGFLHAGFQFRFRSFGRQAGAFDAWHVDYAYLDAGRSQATPYPGRPDPPERFIKDIAVTRPISSLLRRYSAMPVRQYFARPETPAAETATSINTEINNLFNNPSFTTFRVRVEDARTGQTLQSCDAPPLQNRAPCNASAEGINANARQQKSFVPDPLPFRANPTPLLLRTTFEFNITGDFLPGVDLSLNNRISGLTELSDYYAYDDNSAEYAAGINQRQGRVAVRYVVNRPDTLAAVRLYLAQVNLRQRGKGFLLQIFDNLNGRPNRLLNGGNDVVAVNYADSLNKFTEYKLRNVVPVRDTFYVGWLQTTENLLPIGLDENTDASRQIFVSLDQRTWLTRDELANPFTGTLMVRPVVGTGLVIPPRITATEPTTTPADLRLYPNPTAGTLAWSDARYLAAQVLDATGRLLLTTSLTTPTLDVSQLPNGLYVLRLSDGKRTATRRFMVLK